MPQPNRYPAMHVQAPNVLGAARAGMGLAQGFQNLQTGALRNRMAEAEMGRQSELQDIRKRLFGGAGDPAGASGMPADPSAGGAAGGMDQGLFLKYAAMDPQGAKQMWDMIGEMDEASREKAREKTETFGPMALGVLQAEPIQQPGLYRTLLDEAKRMGIQGMPETWSQDAMAWLGLQTTKAMSMGEAIDYYEEEEAVKGQSPLGKLAADRKSGLLDEETFQAARASELRSPDDATALQKDVPFIAETMGISRKAAMEMKMMSDGKTPQAFKADVAARMMSGGLTSPEEAFEAAEKLTGYVYGTAEQEPTPKEKGLLARAMEAMGFGGEEASAFTDKIPAMDLNEITILVKERGAELSDQERQAISDRLDELEQ